MSRLSLLCLLLFLSLFASILLSADEPVRVDRYGDPLPEQALARLGTVRFRNGAEINALTYSPDGKTLASTRHHHLIDLWDAHSGQKLCTVDTNKEWVYHPSFSLDGKLLVSARPTLGDTGEIRLRNLETGKTWAQPLKAKETNWKFAISPDRKIMASGHDSSRVRLWEVQTGKMIRVSPDDDSDRNQITVLAFAPDGKFLIAAGSNGKILFLNMPAGNQVTRNLSMKGEVKALQVSPDANIIAVGGDDGLRLYRAATMKEVHRLEGHRGTVLSLAFCPDGKTLVTGGQDGTIRFWDVGSGKPRLVLPNQNAPVHLLAISPDGKTVASANDEKTGVIHLWDVQTGKSRLPRNDHLGTINQVKFLPDGQTVVSIEDTLNVSTWQQNQPVVSIDDAAKVVIWPRGSGKESHTLALPKESQECLLCADGSTLAVTTTEGAILLLDIPSGRERVRCPIARETKLVHVSADNQRAFVWLGKDRVGEVWDLTRKKVIHRFERRWPWGFSPDGRMLLLETEAGVKVLEVDTKKEVSRWDVPGRAVRAVAFSPDGRMVVTYCGDVSISLWEVATGKQRLLLSEYMKYINAFVFSPDGRTLAIGGTPKIALFWDLRDGREIHAFSGHSGTINSLAFSLDGRRLVSGSNDTTALVWEIPAACRERKDFKVKLGQLEREKLWDKLGYAGEAADAYAAMQQLAAMPGESVALCRAQLFAKPTRPDEIQRWIAQLDDEEFAVREQASRRLERLGSEGGTAVETALKGDCSLEVRRRLESVQKIWERNQPRIRPRIRVLRAVELLEQIGTPEAVDVLRQLEKKTGDAAVRDDVRRSLDRLAAKQKAP